MRTIFQNKKITVMGLGSFGGGVGVTQFLVKQGARVTVTDLRNARELSSSMQQLEGLPIIYKLGRHDEEDFIHTDMIIVNPAVPKDSRFLQIARDNCIPMDTEINIFFTLCPTEIIGITGSNGKSTTTSLIGRILPQTTRTTWVGGNIGKSLLIHLEEIKPQDIVVLELSSFQLKEFSTMQRSPHISVLTNLSPNHLDRHADMDDYVQSKKNIVLYQKSQDYAILNYDDPELRKWEKECKGHVFWYSAKDDVRNGVFVKDNDIVLSFDNQVKKIPCISGIRMPGVHNTQNILAASCAAYLAGAGEQHIKNVVTTFTGLEHRLEFVREVNGVRYFNDSKATTPESAITAIKAFQGNVLLIAGGTDKGSNFDEFAEACIRYTRAVILIGKTAKKIQECILQKAHGEKRPLLCMPNTFKEAFQQAHALAKAGDIVLLSPACASYDMFLNYEDRGRQFKQMIQAL